jgi:hypothetical protein
MGHLNAYERLGTKALGIIYFAQSPPIFFLKMKSEIAESIGGKIRL